MSRPNENEPSVRPEPPGPGPTSGSSTAGAAPPPAPVSPAGRLGPGGLLGKYLIVRVLDEGGRGSVFEGFHGATGKPVAIKVLNTAFVLDGPGQERFARQAEALRQIEHPNLAGLIDFGHERGVSYLVMELYRGENLASVLSRSGKGFDITWTVDVALAVCAGVHAGHVRGLVHQDLRPQSVFLTRSQQGELLPKVLDFGLANLLATAQIRSQTNPGWLKTAVHYLAPEQVRGDVVGAHSDQYAVGVLLYRCLGGRLPHDGDTFYTIMSSITAGRCPPLRQLRPDVPAELEAVVMLAMATRPEDRFASVADLARALLRFASARGRLFWSARSDPPRTIVPTAATLPMYVEPPRPPERTDRLPRRPPPRRRWVAAAALVLALLAGVGLSTRAGRARVGALVKAGGLSGRLARPLGLRADKAPAAPAPATPAPAAAPAAPPTTTLATATEPASALGPAPTPGPAPDPAAAPAGEPASAAPAAGKPTAADARTPKSTVSRRLASRVTKPARHVTGHVTKHVPRSGKAAPSKPTKKKRRSKR